MKCLNIGCTLNYRKPAAQSGLYVQLNRLFSKHTDRLSPITLPLIFESEFYFVNKSELRRRTALIKMLFRVWRIRSCLCYRRHWRSFSGRRYPSPQTTAELCQRDTLQDSVLFWIGQKEMSSSAEKETRMQSSWSPPWSPESP